MHALRRAIDPHSHSERAPEVAARLPAVTVDQAAFGGPPCCDSSTALTTMCSCCACAAVLVLQSFQHSLRHNLAHRQCYPWVLAANPRRPVVGAQTSRQAVRHSMGQHPLHHALLEVQAELDIWGEK